MAECDAEIAEEQDNGQSLNYPNHLCVVGKYYRNIFCNRNGFYRQIISFKWPEINGKLHSCLRGKVKKSIFIFT